MPEPIIRRGDVFQGADFTFLDRIVSDESGTLLDPDDVTSWTLRVFERNDQRDGRKIVDAVTPTGYLNATTATTNGWTRDTTGWNFKYRLQYTTFRAEAREYRFEFEFLTTTYGKVYSVWMIRYKPMGSL